MALEKARRKEAKDVKKGYRWYRVNERNRVFVPCYKNGTPTKEGLKAIERYKAYLGIK